MIKKGRALALSLCMVMVVSAFTTGCTNDENGGGNDSSIGLDKDTKGEVSIMMWSGDSEYYEDLGHKDWTEKDIKTKQVAGIYAVAKKFNEKYPNIKINLYAKTGDPDQPGTPSWDQEMENFKTDHGKYPDVWVSTDVPNDIKKGIVADLSVYKEDSTYKSYNKNLMDNLNYYGFQAGVPSYSIPWGVWVNKSLAEENNIDVPDYDWNIEEYTDFITSADRKTFWGDKGTPIKFIETGTQDINKNILENGKVDVTTQDVKDMLSYVPEWAENTIDVAQGAKELSVEIAKESGMFSYRFFCNNRLLTLSSDPWYLASAADPDANSDVEVVKADSWDIYPRPSTDYCENTVGVVMDPLCIHNYALDDGKKEWSESEEQKRLVSYTFVTYWTAATEAKQAIADQGWMSGASLKESATNDSFPVVTGDEYDKQMEIWYDLNAHKVYKDENSKPGFQQIVKLWKEGKIWDYTDKTTTISVTENGTKKECLYEWNHMWDESVAGAWQTDPDWVDNVKSKLSDWNKKMNERLEEAQKQLKDALVTYYGMKEADLK